MTRRRTLWSLAVWGLLSAPALAEEFHAIATDDVQYADYEAAFAADQRAAALADYNRMHYDSDVHPAQASSQGSSNQQGSRTATRSRASRVPYMIGDSPSGHMGSYEFMSIYDSAQTPLVSIDKPVLGGRRINVAEANTAMPEDRLIFSYRHFHNALDTQVLGQTNVLNIDQWVVGFEKTFCDSLGSVSVQLPVHRELNSELDLVDDGSHSNPLASDYHGEIGNMGVIFKLLLTGQDNFALSTGVGVGTPTADDASVRGEFDSDFQLMSNPAVRANGSSSLFFDAEFENHTVNLVPYFAWAMRPCDRFFHQGFFQVDVPLNSSEAHLVADGAITPDSIYDPESFSVESTKRLSEQVLMRVNLGFGYWICQGGQRDWCRGVAAIFEAHYTTNLNDADQMGMPLASFTDPSTTYSPLDLVVQAGHTHGDFDIVNLNGGFAIDMGTCLFTHGIAVPVSEDPDRSFDCEYNMQAHMRF